MRRWDSWVSAHLSSTSVLPLGRQPAMRKLFQQICKKFMEPNNKKLDSSVVFREWGSVYLDRVGRGLGHHTFLDLWNVSYTVFEKSRLDLGEGWIVQKTFFHVFLEKKIVWNNYVQCFLEMQPSKTTISNFLQVSAKDDSQQCLAQD